ncbi:MAG: tRNA-dihydrouridine synthase, partial [Solirubrobacterales bacterium]
RIDVPVIVSGGLQSAEHARLAYEESAADAVMVARGSLGYPWIFEELTGRRSQQPEPAEIIAELEWVLERGERHWGEERAARNLRKFYPWYLERLGVEGPAADAFQRTERVSDVRAMLAEMPRSRLAAASQGRLPASL